MNRRSFLSWLGGTAAVLAFGKLDAGVNGNDQVDASISPDLFRELSSQMQADNRVVGLGISESDGRFMVSISARNGRYHETWRDLYVAGDTKPIQVRGHDEPMIGIYDGDLHRDPGKSLASAISKWKADLSS